MARKRDNASSLHLGLSALVIFAMHASFMPQLLESWDCLTASAYMFPPLLFSNTALTRAFQTQAKAEREGKPISDGKLFGTEMATQRISGQ